MIRNMSKFLNTDTQELALAFKALSNPNRLQIFMQLLACCPAGTACSISEAQKFCVSDLGKNLDIAPSTLSHHIKELHHAGLLRMQRRGQHIDCWVDPDKVRTLQHFFQQQPISAVPA
jgi:ArsR family transcriptional regulator, arsenate/arsenite/antimonite-responsive transcriptional repressor